MCRGPVNLSPWLYCIPSDLAPFHDLLAQLGVRESFGTEQYVSIMADMAAALNGERLSAEQQDQAIAVLQVQCQTLLHRMQVLHLQYQL